MKKIYFIFLFSVLSLEAFSQWCGPRPIRRPRYGYVTPRPVVVETRIVPRPCPPPPPARHICEHTCRHVISDNEFNFAKNAIVSRDFDRSKLLMAKQIIDNNYFYSNQVKELVGLFDFESSRLEIAKYAYQRTLDPGNYYMVNTAFRFDSSVEELYDYIGYN